ncbi:hypothetical protein ACJ6WD_09545 [Streptomyces sp. VTCC 41912]|uniref:hypothetical protein n=1 Tax=Streptomyces sp. VTCC 41912 TaxID=3383243 RepID=UPI003896CC4F
MTVSPEDIAEMRRQGDLKEFLLSLTPTARRTPKQAAPAEPKSPVEIPRERPGAWPTGSRRPTPPPPTAAADVQAAIEDYRAWLRAGRPPASDKCPCIPCRHATGGLA